MAQTQTPAQPGPAAAAPEPEAAPAAPPDHRAGPAAARGRLGAVAFLAGSGSLATEVCASRLLAPYFGSSTIVWANIIGLILIYLSVGYWVGGRVADRWPTARQLGGVLVAAAGLLALLPFIAHPVLDAAVRGFDQLSVGAIIGSFFAALLLFSLPVTLLGMVAPYCIRLGISEVESAGTVAGRLYALSTMGSIIGTFVPALLLIPAVGTQRTLLVFATLVACAGALVLGARAAVAVVLIGALVGLPPGAVRAGTGLLYETESQYQYVAVRERGDGSRVLLLDDGLTTHSVWHRDTVLSGGEWDMFLVTPPLVGRADPRVLVIGNAGGTTARAFARLYPGATIDGVEIDPAVTAAGERYLGLGDNPRLRVISADGRPYLATTRETYDLILVDAYRQPYVPFYMATREFFELARSRLRPGGAVALNVEAVPGDEALARAIEGTVAASFPEAFAWKPLRFNELVIGLERPQGRDRLAGRVAAGMPFAALALGPLFRDGVHPLAAAADPMTDDHAPVEWYTDRAIIRYVAAGGRSVVDQLLPTDPARRP